MTAREAAMGLPDWAKLLLPVAVTLGLATAAWAVQWGSMQQGQRQDRETLVALNRQIENLAIKVDTYTSSTITLTEKQRADDRRLSTVESELAGARAASGLIATQIGEMRAVLQALRDEQQMLRRSIENGNRRASLGPGALP